MIRTTIMNMRGGVCRFVLMIAKAYNESMRMVREAIKNDEIYFEIVDKVTDKPRMSEKAKRMYLRLPNDVTFMPKEIMKRTLQECKVKMALRWTCDDMMFTIIGYTRPNKEEQSELMRTLLKQLVYAKMMSSFGKCNMRGRELRSVFYDLDAPKVFPKRGELINIINVNSAFTTACSYGGDVIELFVYRREECDKVYIHELIHAFSLDIDREGDGYNTIDSELAKMFGVTLRYKLEEAYTEFCARMIHNVIVGQKGLIPIKTQSEKRMLCEDFAKRMDEEIDWAIGQIGTVCFLSGLSMNLDRNAREPTLFVKSGKDDTVSYKEGTSVMSYYIIAGIFMVYYETMLEWMSNYNDNFIDFNTNQNNVSAFMNLIQQLSLNEHTCLLMLDAFDNVANSKGGIRSARMSYNRKN